jgi:gamma-glutamyl:cysteine ligase YbdK (ATP-grasp superfamily)
MRTFGVEEEFLLVDASTGEPRPLGQETFGQCFDDRLTCEIKQEQIGTGTRPHRDVNDLAMDLARCRALADDAASRAVTPLASPGPRYEEMQDRFALTASEQLTCGCHIHVGVEDDDEGVAVLDRIRAWLPVLLALSANPPFWNGMDTGYASYRSDDAVLLALLTRGLVETAAREWSAGVPPLDVPTATVRMASWHAGRFGMDGNLLHPLTARPQDAGAVALALLQYVRPALRDQGDAEIAESLLRQLLARGTGSRRQRAALLRRGDPGDVVSEAVRVTNLPRGGITDQHEAAVRPARRTLAGLRAWGAS